jgi:hypothetical protein
MNLSFNLLAKLSTSLLTNLLLKLSASRPCFRMRQ